MHTIRQPKQPQGIRKHHRLPVFLKILQDLLCAAIDPKHIQQNLVIRAAGLYQLHLRIKLPQTDPVNTHKQIGK